MARRPRSERQLQLQGAQAALKGERAALKQQQARVAAARRVVDELSRCDCCGARVLPCGGEEQLCLDCFRQRREQGRVALLAQHGYGPDGRRIAVA
jgi:hypothetical protein